MPMCAICGEESEQVSKCNMCGETFGTCCTGDEKGKCWYCIDDVEDILDEDEDNRDKIDYDDLNTDYNRY
jgi:hypothetical protein